MDIISFFITILLTAAITYLIIYYLQISASVKRSEHEALLAEFQSQKNLNVQQESKLESITQLYDQEADLNREQQYTIKENQAASIHLHKQIATLSADNRSLLEKMDEQMENFTLLQANSKQEFKLIAQQLLEEKSKSFETEHKKGLNEVLAPLKERIKSFEDKVDYTNKESIARHSSLKQQIVDLKDVNEKMSSEAQNLTNALKQDTKAQGNWGELILESILDKSGLEKGREYFVQHNLKNDQGRNVRPDVIINLPDGKKIIIDSKVSLKAYEVFINATEQITQTSAHKAHALSIRNHIDGLASKNYHDLYKIESPDFVMMFVPIETAFSAALAANQDLYNYAFDKNIVIVTPSTLLATLKTVETIWRNDKQNRYALEIATEAGKMYDKFVLLTQDLTKIGQRIGQTQEAYNDSMKKLHTGSGNLISKAEKLKKLGAKANKSLPNNKVQRAE